VWFDEVVAALGIEQLVEVLQLQAGEQDLFNRAALLFQVFRLGIDGSLVHRAAIAPLRCARDEQGAQPV